VALTRNARAPRNRITAHDQAGERGAHLRRHPSEPPSTGPTAWAASHPRGDDRQPPFFQPRRTDESKPPSLLRPSMSQERREDEISSPRPGRLTRTSRVYVGDALAAETLTFEPAPA